MDSNDLAIIGIGVSLLIAMLGIWRDTKGDMRDLRSEMQALRVEMQSVRTEVHLLGERVSRIEGRLDERDHHDA